MAINDSLNILSLFPYVLVIAENKSEFFNLVIDSGKKITKQKEYTLLQGDDFLIRVMPPGLKLVGLKFQNKRPALIILETDNYEPDWYYRILRRQTSNIIRWP